jgi:hypothetical protein
MVIKTGSELKKLLDHFTVLKNVKEIRIFQDKKTHHFF